MGTPGSLAIVGSREFTDYAMLSRIVDAWIKEHGTPARIISGGAQGADALAERYAGEHAIALVVYRPQYEACRRNPRLAPLLRNQRIVDDATAMIAFPSRDGRGTQDAMGRATSAKIPCEVHFID